MGKSRILLEQDNIISLRTAFVQDDGRLVEFRLMPGWLESSIPTGRKPRDFDWTLLDSAWIYRHVKSAADEFALMSGFACVEQGVKPLMFDTPPVFKLQWTDSGHGVALYLNGEPWAFVHEETHKGYSKGVLDPTIGELWNQELFKKFFLKG